jgi:hypothetical protein
VAKAIVTAGIPKLLPGYPLHRDRRMPTAPYWPAGTNEGTPSTFGARFAYEPPKDLVMTPQLGGDSQCWDLTWSHTPSCGCPDQTFVSDD